MTRSDWHAQEKARNARLHDRMHAILSRAWDLTGTAGWRADATKFLVEARPHVRDNVMLLTAAYARQDQKAQEVLIERQEIYNETISALENTIAAPIADVRTRLPKPRAGRQLRGRR